MKETIYFAHPMRTYGTPEALAILQELAEVYKAKVIDPEDWGSLGPWVSCKECMDKYFKKVWFPEIEKCSKFAIWPALNTCGIACELHYAWQLGKPVIHIAYQHGEIEFEDMTLQEYHDITTMVEAD